MPVWKCWPSRSTPCDPLAVIEVRPGGLDLPAVQALLAHHHREAHSRFPAEFAHALPPSALADPAIAVFTAWDGAALLGIAALRLVEPGHGEVKSMRTHPDALRRGVGRVLLERVIAEARARGWIRMSLETGTGPEFDPANRLYEGAGFVEGPAFGGYPPSPYNRFMTMTLD